jgi:hypothetical protein
MNRRVFVLAAIAALFSVAAQAQEVTGFDRSIISFGNEPVAKQQSGDYIIDIDLFALSQPKLPKYDLSVAALLRNFDKAFSLNNDVVYSQVGVPLYSSVTGGYDGVATMNSATYKLRNGARLTTYGNFGADGRRNPYAGTPWSKMDFRGGAEIKFNNGFRFGVEVQYQKNNGRLHDNSFFP